MFPQIHKRATGRCEHVFWVNSHIRLFEASLFKSLELRFLINNTSPTGPKHGSFHDLPHFETVWLGTSKELLQPIVKSYRLCYQASHAIVAESLLIIVWRMVYGFPWWENMITRSFNKNEKLHQEYTTHKWTGSKIAFSLQALFLFFPFTASVLSRL